MSDSNGASQKIQESPAVELTGRIMVVAMIVLFLVVAFVVFLHLYAKWYWRRVGQDGIFTSRRRRRMDFAAGHSEEAATAAMKHGLDPTFLKNIPILLFSSQEFKDGLECSVCLSEVSDGENVRLLPKCNHGFHVECIDMWFSSHSTCPICRNHVFNSSPSTPEFTHNTPETEHSVSAVGVSGEGLSFPTNVLFWGNEVEVSTLASVLDDSVTSSEEVSSQSVVSSTSSSDNNIADEHLVIDIPRQINEDEDQKSPLATRLRSLKRLLSRDRKINPSNDDVEQAGRS